MKRAGRRIGFVLTGALLGLSVAPARGQNVQPISTSLAECAAIYGSIASHPSAARRSEAEIASVAESAEAFYREAVTQAGGEGHAFPVPHIETVLAEKSAHWDGRLFGIFSLGQTRDWLDYCRALGWHRGLPVPGRGSAR